MILISLSLPLCDVLSDRFPLFDIVYNNVCMNVLAFNVENAYYCYLEE